MKMCFVYIDAKVTVVECAAVKTTLLSFVKDDFSLTVNSYSLKVRNTKLRANLNKVRKVLTI